MVPPNIWHALRQTAIICLLAIGLGIGFALVTCSTGCAWSPTAKQERYAAYATEATALGALACDAGSTQQFLADSTYVETNPLLGKHPSAGTVWLYLGAIGAVVVAANHAIPMPAWARIGIGSIVSVAEISSSVHNVGYGTSPCGIGEGGPWGEGSRELARPR
jgi:hypothetical protein